MTSSKPARMPKAALGPLAIAIIFLMWWSFSRARPGAVSDAAFGVRGTGRLTTDHTLDEIHVVEASHETSTHQQITLESDGRRRVFTPFARAKTSDPQQGRMTRKTGDGKSEDDDDDDAFQFERVRQVIDDSHLPSLPPLPPSSPPLLPDDNQVGFDFLSEQTVTRETKRVTGGDFVWHRPEETKK
tara:strand:+ start:120 stop:677 length:558 start_codon:yes stop_codon:yes gene_type:complete